MTVQSSDEESNSQESVASSIADKRVNYGKVKSALNNFEPYKTAGVFFPSVKLDLQIKSEAIAGAVRLNTTGE